MANKNQTALIAIDIQEKLFRLMHKKEALLSACKQMIQGARVLELPIVWAEQYPQGLGSTVAELAELLPGEPIPKKTFSVWAHEPLRKAIEATGCSRFLLMGIESHVCVFQTARDLLEQGHHVEVVADCVSSRTAANRCIGLDRIAQHGGKLTSVEMCLFDLLRHAEGSRFKQILPVVS